MTCSDGIHQCWEDGGVIPDAPLLDASVDAALDGAGDVVDAVDTSNDTIDGAVIRCDSGTQCGAECVDLSSDPNNCAACSRACPGVVHGVSTCTSGVCDFMCTPGFHACGTSCADDTSPLSCGTLCTPCVAPAGAHGTCASGACGWECEPAYDQMGDHCELRVPRQISPLSTSFVSSQQPALTWELPAGVDGATVEICRDHGFSVGCQSINATGTSTQPMSPLTAGVWFWRVHGRVGGITGSRTGPVWTLNVGARNAPHASTWGSIFDANGDGRADLAVGAWGVNASTGRLHAYYGTGSSLPSTPDSSIDGRDGSNSSFARAIANAGDVNGDGFSDLIVGAYQSRRAYVFHGSPTGLVPAIATTLAGSSSGLFGRSVASAGDVNGDGYADVVVGDSSAGRGSAFVYLGSATGVAATPAATLTNPGTGGSFGDVVASAGDANGDGYGDIVVGSPFAGRAYVFHGSGAGIETAPASTLMNADASFGSAIGCAGDVNGDGYSDVIVGAPGSSGGLGAAFIFTGSAGGIAATPMRSLSGADAGAQFGSAVGSAGDLNGDGFSDVAIGAPWYSTSTGRAFVFLGGLMGTSSSAAATLTGTDGTNASFGCEVLGLGDVNGDSMGDVIIGASGVSAGTGRAYVFGGTSMGTTTTAVVTLLGRDGPAGYFGARAAGYSR